MGQENNSWFARNRGVVFGFAIAILILNIVVLILVPTQTPISIEQTATEYALDDESFAVEHAVTLTGTLTKSMIHKNMFIGTLTISGVDGMEQPYPLEPPRCAYEIPGISAVYGILTKNRAVNLFILFNRALDFLTPTAYTATVNEIKELKNCMGGNEHETEKHQRGRTIPQGHPRM